MVVIAQSLCCCPFHDHEITIAQFLLFIESNEECIMRNKDDLQKLWNHRFAIMNATN